MTAAWKKLHFLLSVRSDFHMIDGLSIAVHAFISHVSMSFSVFHCIYIFSNYFTCWQFFSPVFFTGVRVTVSLLKSLGFFFLFWPNLTMLQFGSSRLVLLSPSLLIPVLVPRWLYQVPPCGFLIPHSWWFSTGVWMTASLHSSLKPSSVFWSILTMQ